jgi:hypothetical protein
VIVKWVECVKWKGISLLLVLGGGGGEYTISLWLRGVFINQEPTPVIFPLIQHTQPLLLVYPAAPYTSKKLSGVWKWDTSIILLFYIVILLWPVSPCSKTSVCWECTPPLGTHWAEKGGRSLLGNGPIPSPQPSICKPLTYPKLLYYILPVNIDILDPETLLTVSFCVYKLPPMRSHFPPIIKVNILIAHPVFINNHILLPIITVLYYL